MKLHPLVARLVEDHDAHVLTLATLEVFLAGGGDRVLLFTGEPARWPEGADGDVVRLELESALAGRFELGVILPGDEAPIALRFGVQRRPALVFVRDARLVASVSGHGDWDAYLVEVARRLAAPDARPAGAGASPSAARASDTTCH